MAVGYQYQQDYNKKQDRKGLKKKLIILGVGIVVLIIIAILGMPKQQSTEENNNQYQQDTQNLVELPTKDGYILDDQQKDIKINTDGFLLAIINGSDYKEYLVPLVYSAVQDKPDLLLNLNGLNLASCILQNIEVSNQNQFSISTYICDGSNLFISSANSSNSSINNRVVNWKILENKDN